MPPLSRETMPFKVVTPSHNRADVFHRNPLLSYSHYLVRDQAHVDTYRGRLDTLGLAHPQGVPCERFPAEPGSHL